MLRSGQQRRPAKGNVLLREPQGPIVPHLAEVLTLRAEPQENIPELFDHNLLGVHLRLHENSGLLYHVCAEARSTFMSALDQRS